METSLLQRFPFTGELKPLVSTPWNNLEPHSALRVWVSSGQVTGFLQPTELSLHVGHEVKNTQRLTALPYHCPSVAGERRIPSLLKRKGSVVNTLHERRKQRRPPGEHPPTWNLCHHQFNYGNVCAKAPFYKMVAQPVITSASWVTLLLTSA